MNYGCIDNLIYAIFHLNFIFHPPGHINSSVDSRFLYSFVLRRLLIISVVHLVEGRARAVRLIYSTSMFIQPIWSLFYDNLLPEFIKRCGVYHGCPFLTFLVWLLIWFGHSPITLIFA